MSKLLQYNGIKWVEIKGRDGLTPTREELVKIIKPLIPEPVPGQDGRDAPTLEEILAKIPTPKNGKDGSPDTYKEIVDKLENIDNESEKLKIEAIQNLREELDDLKKKWSSRPMFGGGGFSVTSMNFHLIDDQTPTGTINSSNTIFNIANVPSPASSLKVYLNGARMRITEDYTLSGTTITFTIAPPTGSILLTDYRT